MAEFDIVEMARRLGVTSYGDRFVTQCPACESPNSLSIGPGADDHGHALANCFDPKCDVENQHDLINFWAGEVSVTRVEVEYEQPVAFPVAWWADHCGVPASFVAALPVIDYDGFVGFAFAGTDAVKTRPGQGKEPFGWNAEDKRRPPLWPVPAETVPPAMLLTEGEGDATVMAYLVARSGLDAVMTVHSVTKGADTVVPARAWREYRERGLRQVLVLFDEDGAGDAGAEKNLRTARGAGLDAVRVHLDGIDPLIGEKDARDLWLRRLTLPERDWDGNKVLCPYADQDMNLTDASLADLGALNLSEIPNVKAPDLHGDPVGIIDPEGHTILYGQGDVGKGVVASVLAANLTRAGHHVLIADFEHHPNEWRRRVEGLGGDYTMVVYKEFSGAMWDVADDVEAVRRAFDADYVIVDSVSSATSGVENEYSPATPVKYTEATSRICGHVLSLAHVTKANDNPAYPFGSIGWHQQARTTFSLADVEGEKVLEHRKQGNRPWQGKWVVEFAFDDETGKIDFSATQVAGATKTPVIVSAGKSARVERLAGTARTVAPLGELSAVSRNGLCDLMGSGARSEKLDGIKLAVARGWLAETPAGKIWAGSGSTSSSGSMNHVNHGVTPVAGPVPATGSPVQTPRTVNREPLPPRVLGDSEGR